MVQGAAMAISFLAGLSLCVTITVTAIMRFQRDAGIKGLLVSLVAAAVALLSGILTIIMTFNLPGAAHGFQGGTANSALFGCLSTLLSAPIGLGWGWASSFARRPAIAIPGEAAGTFAVRGMILGLLAASVFILACLLAALARHGHDSSVAAPGLAATFAFLGATILVTALVLFTCWHERPGPVLRHIGTGLGIAISLAFGVLAGATGVASLLQDMARRMEAWNILIFFYPIYILGLFALAAALLLLAAKTFARMQSRLPAS